MKKYFLGFIGLVLMVYSLVSSIAYSDFTWFSYFVIGSTLFFAFINYLLKNDSLFEKGFSYIVKTYVVYMFFTIFIEILGRFILHFWVYPHLDFVGQLIHVFVIGYPFVFFSINETLKILTKFMSKTNWSLLVVLSTILNCFVHELPNLYSWEWVYTIPYIKFSILNINIVVIVGWVFLVLVPLWTRKILSKL